MLIPYLNRQIARPIFIYFLLFIFFLSSSQSSFANQERLALINVSVDSSIMQAPDNDIYNVKVLTGHLRTKSGTTRTYTLYLPEKSSVLPAAPYPLLVLVHGFLMTGHQHSGNAKYFAQRGFAVLTPDMTKILLGDQNRMRNVHDILDQISWLLKESNSKASPFNGLIDSTRVGIAGNSAGGAVCLEMILEAQKANIPIHAICSLDGVPWDRTKDLMSSLKPVNILSLRAEPGLCNYYSRMVPYLKLLKFPYNDVKINGAHHCDVENPTTLGCRCVCGKSSAKYRNVFQHLTYLYFRDTFNVPAQASAPSENFIEAVASLKSNGLAIANLNQLKPTQIAGTQQSQ